MNTLFNCPERGLDLPTRARLTKTGITILWTHTTVQKPILVYLHWASQHLTGRYYTPVKYQGEPGIAYVSATNHPAFISLDEIDTIKGETHAN